MNSRHLAKGANSPPPLLRGKLRLYSNRFCPYSQRVLLVLESKKIVYEVINIDTSNKPDWMFDRAPKGVIPAIELGTGDVIYDSLVIADYLDDKYPHNRLHPRDPLQKAMDQLLLRHFTRVINAVIKTLYGRGVDRGETDEVIAEGLNIFEHDLTNRKGPYFGGAKPAMLDYMIWPWCERSDVLKVFGKAYLLKKDKYKRLMEWCKLMSEHEVVKKSALDSDTHIKYLQSRQAGISDYNFQNSL